MALAAAALTAAASPDKEIAAKVRRLKRCPGGKELIARSTPRDWQDVASRELDHRAVRAALGVVMPSAATRVTIYLSGGHLEVIEASIVAVRGPDGIWRVDAVGRRGIAVAGTEFTPMRASNVTLSAEQGARVDTILDDRCFWAEPVSTGPGGSGPPPLGALSRSMEVDTPKWSRRAVGVGTTTGLTGELDTLLTQALG